ncbi:MAG: DUF4313 domain-containing protein [Streptococcus sp.]
MNEKKNRNERKTLPFPWAYGQEEITLKVSSYAYGNGLAILMYRQEEGKLELFDDLTVNLPGGYGLKPQEAFISGDFTKDKLAFIEKNRLGNILPGQARSGFATYTPVAFDLARLAQYDRKVWKNFADNGGWMCQKNRKRPRETYRQKKRERER